MARILAISSWVAAGHVGLSAIAPALQRLGHEVIQIPTVMLSNHRGFAHAAGTQTAPETMLEMVEAIAANGWIDGLDAMLTGYLPSAAHVETTMQIVETVRSARPGVSLLVDPVLGDAPKGLYLPEATARAVAGILAPQADILTPNLFELEWLSARRCGSPGDAAAAARALMENGRIGRVLVTSPPLAPGETGVIDILPESASLYRSRLIEKPPNGPGDVFAGLIAAGTEAGHAVGMLSALLTASAGHPHLRLVDADWATAPPVSGDTI